MYEEFKSAVDKYSGKKSLGTRKKFSFTEELQSDGKVLKKYCLSDKYEWLTYSEVHKKVKNLSNGLLVLGLKSNDNIVINAETRAEWLISALACFRINVPIVTLYATLGIDALKYGIDETKAKFIIISSEQIPKIEKILSEFKTLTHIIVMIDSFHQEIYNKFVITALNLNIKVSSFNECIESGNKTPVIKDYSRPKCDDLAIVMYTSGSTGNPKGSLNFNCKI
jgi:long-chain acyl-CoA synthetase